MEVDESELRLGAHGRSYVVFTTQFRKHKKLSSSLLLLFTFLNDNMTSKSTLFENEPTPEPDVLVKMDSADGIRTKRSGFRLRTHSDRSNHDNNKDVVAVLEYKGKSSREVKDVEYVACGWFFILLGVVIWLIVFVTREQSHSAIGAIVTRIVLAALLFLLALLCCFIGTGSIRPELYFYTVITKSGLRHAIEPSSHNDSYVGVVLEIPFSDIAHVRIYEERNEDQTDLIVGVMTKADDASHFVVSGAPLAKWSRNKFMLPLEGLKDPIAAKNLLVSKIARAKKEVVIVPLKLVSTTLTKADIDSPKAFAEIRNDRKRRNSLAECHDDSIV